MRLGILTSGRAKQADDPALLPRLVEAGRAAGHEVVVLHEPEMMIVALDDRLEVTHLGQPLPAFDVIINRPGYVTEPGLHAVTTEALKKLGIRVVNHSPLVGASKNKLAGHLVLQAAGVPMPAWAIARRPEWAVKAAEVIGYPVMIKVAFGTHGKGVFYAQNVETLAPIVDYLNIRDGNPVIVEKFLVEAKRKDLRVFVVGGEVVAAMERQAKDGEMRANAALGGTGKPVDLTDKERRIAIQASRAFDLEIAGVDLLRSAEGPLVIEVNANPGFEELERATGVDVAGAIIDFLEK